MEILNGNAKLVLKIHKLSLNPTTQLPTPEPPSAPETCKPNDCAKGYVWNKKFCQCICNTAPNCPEGSVQMFLSEPSSCRPKHCNMNFVQNLETCECECPLKEPHNCTHGKVWMENYCECNYDPILLCDEGYIMIDCECIEDSNWRKSPPPSSDF